MDNNYDATGIAAPKPLGSVSPPSNPGIVYEPANQPTAPGSFKVAPQTVKSLLFQTQDAAASNILVGTADTSPADVDGMAAIVFKSGSVNANQVDAPPIFMGVDIDRVEVDINQLVGADTPIPPFSVNQVANPNNQTEVADFNSQVIISTHFSPIFFFGGPNSLGNFVTLYISDGTNPSGILSGDVGDVCFNGSTNGAMAYCQGGTSWTLAS